MLSPVTAVRFDRRISSGRTVPSAMACIKDDGTEVELVVKLRAGCEMKNRSLLAEALAAALAADLDLPCPEPFLVMIEAPFAGSITDAEIRTRAQASLGWNFGSMKLPPGFSTIAKGRSLPASLLQVAAEILAFDTFIANPDRTVDNPNCLSNGRDLAIYDHELAFFTEGSLGWKPPWEQGAVQFPKGIPAQNRHVFLDQLRGKPLDLRRLTGAIEGITADRLVAYRSAIPRDWLGDGQAIERIIGYIGMLRENVTAAACNLCEALR